MDTLEYSIFETAFGWMGVLASRVWLVATTLPRPSARHVRLELGIDERQAICSSRRLSEIEERLKDYFKGEKVDFSDKLDLSTATPFQKQVWLATRSIPSGQTRSYQWVAVQIGKPGAARAVGQALGRNPLPIIVPCHRVLASGGGLGGFGGGLELKRRLLRLEGSSVGA